jgi:hypothetical protein
MDDATQDQILLEGMKLFGRHLVSLSCTHYKRKDGSDPRHFKVSGFLISISDMWYIGTAAHVFDQIDTLMKDHPERDYLFRINDAFAKDAGHTLSIVFDYPTSMRHVAADYETTGADFGLIYIEPFYRLQMEANPQTPLTERQWRKQPVLRNVHHMMIGIPSENIAEIPADAVKSDSVHRQRFDINMLFLKQITELPSRIIRYPYPMFYAELGETPDLESIAGMSGCPILAIGKTDEGEVRYFIEAVLIGWYYERMPRIIYAADFKSLMYDVEQWLDYLSVSSQRPSDVDRISFQTSMQTIVGIVADEPTLERKGPLSSQQSD